MQTYFDPTRESDPYALPDVEVFTGADYPEYQTEDGATLEPDKYYFWACFPGCLPDSDPCGPYDTEAEAIAAAQEDSDLE